MPAPSGMPRTPAQPAAPAPQTSIGSIFDHLPSFSDVTGGVVSGFRKLVGWETPPEPIPYAKYPAYLHDGNPQISNTFDLAEARGHLTKFDPKTLPKSMSAVIDGYRADPTGKFGGTNGLETQPYKLYAAELYANVRAMARAKQYGAPQLSAPELAALALKEGKSFFGVNPVMVRDPKTKELSSITYYDPTQKADKELSDKLVASGFDERTAGFPVTLANKMRAAVVAKKPWTNMWIGTGKSAYGETGDKYTAAYKDFVTAAGKPENAPLVQFIQSALDAENPPKPRIARQPGSAPIRRQK